MQEQVGLSLHLAAQAGSCSFVGCSSSKTKSSCGRGLCKLSESFEFGRPLVAFHQRQVCFRPSSGGYKKHRVNACPRFAKDPLDVYPFSARGTTSYETKAPHQNVLVMQEALTRRSSTSTISDGLRECMHTPRRLRPRQLPQPVYSKPQNEAFHQQKLKTNQAHALQTRTRLPLSQSQISSWSFARACEL